MFSSRFWDFVIRQLLSFLTIFHKCSLVIKSSIFSLQGIVSSFNKVVLHVAFSELSLLLSFQGWQEQVPNSHTSATKDRPNSDYDAGNNLVLLAIRKILLGRLTPEKTLNSKTSLFVLLCRLKRSQMWLTQMWEGAKNRLKSLEKL